MKCLDFAHEPSVWRFDVMRASFVMSRPFEVSRRAFLSSKSNTTAGEIVIKKASQAFPELGRKNEDISKSVSSIDRGTIFQPRSGHELSRNVIVVSVYAF